MNKKNFKLKSKKKILPYSLLGERMVLGIILTDPNAINIVYKKLTIDAFYLETHQIIYEGALSLHEQGKPVNYTTIITWIEDQKLVNKFNDSRLIINLINQTVYTSFLNDYIAIVYEKFLRRSIIQLGQEIKQYGFFTEVSLEDLFFNIEDKILTLTQTYQKQNLGSTADIFSDILTEIRTQLISPKITGLFSGFLEIDNIIQGFQKSDLVILAGRPSMGKTALILNITKNISDQFSIDSVFFSLELTRQQLMYRLLSTEAKISLNRLKAGKISKNEWVQINKSVNKLSRLPLFVDDSPDLSILDIQAKLKHLKRTQSKNLGLVIIDYLQLLENSKDESRVQELSKITRALKKLARTMNITIVVLSQLSRNVEIRQNKRPILSDLRDSGSIEQDADVVLMLYRDEYYNPNTTNKNRMEVIVAKQRNGPIGTAFLKYIPKYFLFEN